MTRGYAAGEGPHASWTRCPRCQGSGVYDDDGRECCLFCGWVGNDPVSTLEALLSNATPEDGSIAVGPRATPDLAAIRERVMARVRMEVEA